MHRSAAVAGTFYPADPTTLREQIDGFLAEAAGSDEPPPKALIAPHAGTIYSGSVAGSAYRLLGPAAASVERVVLIGPSHRVPLRGLAVPSVEAFDTPLGAIPVDREAVTALLALPQVSEDDEPHRREHSLEVHLPFLQRTLRAFRLVPLVVGVASAEEVAEVLDRVWGGPETLIVVSSDLSHFLDYASAKRLDADTARAIEDRNDRRLDGDRACGYHGLRGLLRVAVARDLTVRRLDLRSSGDTAGSKRQVVGYGSWALS
jgi:MEMO1 family protein